MLHPATDYVVLWGHDGTFFPIAPANVIKNRRLSKFYRLYLQFFHNYRIFATRKRSGKGLEIPTIVHFINHNYPIHSKKHENNCNESDGSGISSAALMCGQGPI